MVYNEDNLLFTHRSLTEGMWQRKRATPTPWSSRVSGLTTPGVSHVRPSMKKARSTAALIFMSAKLNSGRTIELRMYCFLV